MNDSFMNEAIVEAEMGRLEGGIPIGSVLVIDDQIIGRGRNQRVQKGNPILHAEMDCLQNAGRLPASAYANATLYTTLSPCHMCSGAILLYKIRRVVIGENQSFQGPEAYLRAHKIELHILNDPQCVKLMAEFMREESGLWDEDIGV